MFAGKDGVHPCGATRVGSCFARVEVTVKGKNVLMPLVPGFARDPRYSAGYEEKIMYQVTLQVYCVTKTSTC
jgi:hypothetical protein